MCDRPYMPGDRVQTISYKTEIKIVSSDPRFLCGLIDWMNTAECAAGTTIATITTLPEVTK